MKKIFLFFVVILFTASEANAARKAAQSASAPSYDQRAVCDVSSACKKICDAKIDDNLEKATPEQQKIILQCAQDMMKSYSVAPQSTAVRPDL